MVKGGDDKESALKDVEGDDEENVKENNNQDDKNSDEGRYREDLSS